MSAAKPGDLVQSPDDTLAIAQSVARAGWPIFPVLVSVKDEHGRTEKQPLIPFTRESSVEPEQVEAWWRRWPHAFIGVYARGAGLLVVDVDTPKDDDGRDGKANLDEAGLTLPKTMKVKTYSGGRHHYYAAPYPYPDDLGITQNKPVPGIDIRAGNGLVVYWGDELVGRPMLAAAPDWAIETATREASVYSRGSADVDLWRERLLGGKPSEALAAIVEDVTEEGMSREDMLATITELVKHAGDPGAGTAYDEARETYTRHYPASERDWDNATRGSIAALGMPLRRIALTKPERKALKRRQRERIARPDTDPDRAIVPRERPSPPTAAAHPDAGHRELSDGMLAEEIVERLRERWVVSRTAGLMRYQGHVWHASDKDVLTEHVRLALRDVLQVELTYAAQRGDDKRLTALATLASRKRMVAIAMVVYGMLANDPAETDAHPDLLGVANGVVDLRTGTLLPHDPLLYLTKQSPVAYDPDATDPVWDQALTALPKKVAEWMRVRFGQAATGHPPDDATMTLLEGSGQNAKSTMFDAVRGALGEHAVTVSDRLLLANPGDHPTELTDLMGARLAIVEELPEGRSLNVKRLKDVLGTSKITARRIRADSVTWDATHSIMLSTNVRPIVAETDHATWRRLALVVFPFRFLAAPRPLRARNDRRADVSIVRHLSKPNAAVLAWIVSGARDWYANGQVLPAPPKRVAADTADWRRDADPVLAYAESRLELADGYAIPVGDLVTDFNAYLESRSQRPWSEQTIAQRVADHVALPDVEKRHVSFNAVTPSRSVRATGRVGGEGYAWVGVRFVMDDPMVPESTEVREHAARTV